MSVCASYALRRPPEPGELALPLAPPPPPLPLPVALPLPLPVPTAPLRRRSMALRSAVATLWISSSLPATSAQPPRPGGFGSVTSPEPLPDDPAPVPGNGPRPRSEDERPDVWEFVAGIPYTAMRALQGQVQNVRGRCNHAVTELHDP